MNTFVAGVVFLCLLVQTACAQADPWSAIALKEGSVTVSEERYGCEAARYSKNYFEGYPESRLRAIHPFSKPVSGHLLLKHSYSYQYYSEAQQKFQSEPRMEYFDYDLRSNSIEKISFLDSLIQPVFFEDDTLVVYEKSQNRLYKLLNSEEAGRRIPYELNVNFITIVLSNEEFQLSPTKDHIVVLNKDPRGGEINVLDTVGNKKRVSTSPQFAHWLSDSLLLYPKDVCVDTAIQDFTVYCLETFNVRSEKSHDFYSERVYDVYAISKSDGELHLYGWKYNLRFSQMVVSSDLKGVRSYVLLRSINRNFDFFRPTKTNGEFVGIKSGPYFYEFCRIRVQE